ncbi:L-malyl-CoA/beta-methylmalyl-CoA lyase [Haloarchaeobius sp. TZWWS8]|uniref:L-malyl-CoA/beta-methylmalyl-CoA lyase n=1 Tax=Haloarchaeobius sp. TZWWS8 TaxID=3446121 RepID=UPI003EBDA1E0
MAGLARTFQTAPAAVPRDNTAKYLDSALGAEGFECPDWLIPDLEDGTAPDMKAEGLDNIVDRLPDHADGFPGEIRPRVQWAHDDEETRDRGATEIRRLVEEVGDYIDGVVVPKVGRLEDVEEAAGVVADAEREFGLADGSIGLAVIVETPEAKSDLREISLFGGGSRLDGLVFGPVDYTAALGGREIGDGRPRWDGLLEDLSNEASANGLTAIGGPFDRLFKERAGVTFYNADGYADHVEREARVGLDGSWSLYPKQTAQANRIHMPTPEELDRDVRKIEAFQEAKAGGTGAVTVEGQMVDEATFKNFVNTVETVREIDAVHPKQTDELYEEPLLERALTVDTTWN